MVKLKHIAIYSLLFYTLFLVGCRERNSCESGLTDVELHDNAANYDKNISEENNNFKIYYNDSEIPYNEIVKYEHLNAVHTKNTIEEKLEELSEFFDEGEYVTKIRYRELISDFNNDSKDDIILSQEWFTSKDSTCSYTYLWYLDDDSCKEILFCGYGQNGLLVPIIDGQSFICLLPEITVGATPAQKAKCFLISESSLAEVYYNNGDLWYGIFDDSNNSGIGTFVVVNGIRKLRPVRWNGSEFYLDDNLN